MALWQWHWGDTTLNQLDVNSAEWQHFKNWLADEERKALSKYPPGQLREMHILIRGRESSK